MPDLNPIALTMGDPAGIGPDLVVSAWLNRQELSIPPFIYIGDIDVVRDRAQMLGVEIKIAECEPGDASANFDTAIPAISIPLTEPAKAGKPSTANANAVLNAIELAVTLTKQGKTSAVVTNPIAKSVLYDAGFRHPGHTEFLAELSRIDNNPAPLPVMMLAGPSLRTVPVTIHIPLMDVKQHLTSALIIKTCEIVAKDLREKFGVATPRLAISGLNPHAGEGGALGSEDGDIIIPAVRHLQDSGIAASGPLPADTMFHEDARSEYDVAICMYHDQALIPAKALGFHDAVNVTLGLPFIRTSPDHGTAFSLAAKNIARHDSLVAALKMAAEMAHIQSGQAK